ncbi:MAG: spore germination protein GerW family protein [Firmicutes bacterium]|nr:spore germination protein GerW family protein [Bacillota bacterium]
MGADSIKGITDNTMEKIRAMADADTVIGKEIVLDSGVTVIPVSKVSFGFASGGSDLPNKANKNLFGGGSGAGVSVTPTAFIVVKGEDVRLLQLSKAPGTADGAVALLPDLFDKITGLFKRDKSENSAEDK